MEVAQDDNIGGIVLAGGQSSRMGRDKGFVLLGDKPMVQHVIDHLHGLTQDILLVANRPEYGSLGLPVVADEYPQMGPLAGIITGLRHSQHDLNLLLACDMPLVGEDLLRWLLDSYSDEPALTLRLGDRLQPLAGLYHRKALPTLERLLTKGQLKLSVALEVLGAGSLDPSQFFPHYHPDSLRNFNTQAEIDAYLQG